MKIEICIHQNLLKIPQRGKTRPRSYIKRGPSEGQKGGGPRKKNENLLALWPREWGQAKVQGAPRLATNRLKLTAGTRNFISRSWKVRSWPTPNQRGGPVATLARAKIGAIYEPLLQFFGFARGVIWPLFSRFINQWFPNRGVMLCESVFVCCVCKRESEFVFWNPFMFLNLKPQIDL